jgi:hypothetical protein
MTTRSKTIIVAVVLALLLAMSTYQTYVIWRVVDAFQAFGTEMGMVEQSFEEDFPTEEDTWLYDDGYTP